MQGPYTVELVQRHAAQKVGARKYMIRLSSARGHLHVVKRRYTHFADLHAVMRAEFPVLPPVPPKSFFRKHFCPGFMARRLQALRELIVAVVAADPYARSPGLCHFLGIAIVSPNGKGRPGRDRGAVRQAGSCSAGDSPDRGLSAYAGNSGTDGASTCASIIKGRCGTSTSMCSILEVENEEDAGCGDKSI